MNIDQLLCSVAVTVSAGVSLGQPVSGVLTRPVIDRWVYPFASQPGAEPGVPVFAALRQSGFDDRDALFLLAFDTSNFVPTGLGPERYVVSALRITAWVSAEDRFMYDSTFDSVATSYDPAEPGYVADSDPGKPVEVFAAGYRNGWTMTSFQESSPYSPFPPFPPQEGVRNVFAAVYDEAGTAVDIGRHVRQHLEAVPLGIGRSTDLAEGQLVPAGAALTFEIDAASGPAQAYLGRAFDGGRVPFIITGLHPASGGPGGGTGEANYPSFFTKENAIAEVAGYTARLEFDVTVYPGADFNSDGGVDGGDVEAFFVAWQAGENIADFNIDGGVDGGDVEAFFIAWEQG
jgi:hypothetical protein